MIRYVSMACWVVVMAAVSSAELTDEQMKSMGATQEQLDAFRAPEVQRPTLTAADYLAAGRSAEGGLVRAIADGPDGVELARDVLHRAEQQNVNWPDYAVLNGLTRQTSETVLDVLEEAVALHGPKSALWQPTRKAWAAAFRRLHGDAGFELARRRLSDPTLTEQERALHLLVFQYARSERRAMAIEVYRPYLHVNAPELQRAAVSVARDLWDYDAKDEIEQVAWSSNDWKARSLAKNLFTSFLNYGPDLDSRPRKRGIAVGGYDPEGLRAWRARMPEWRREHYRVTTGEEPPPGWPNPEPRSAAEAAGSSPGSGSSSRTPRPHGTP
jgi:hypothetical protein